MRNPDRIPEMIEELAKMWELVPDQRLGQLIMNLSRSEDGMIRDPWHIEDDDMLRRLKNINKDYY